MLDGLLGVCWVSVSVGRGDVRVDAKQRHGPQTPCSGEHSQLRSTCAA